MVSPLQGWCVCVCVYVCGTMGASMCCQPHEGLCQCFGASSSPKNLAHHKLMNKAKKILLSSLRAFANYFNQFLFPAPPEGRGQAGHAEKANYFMSWMWASISDMAAGCNWMLSTSEAGDSEGRALKSPLGSPHKNVGKTMGPRVHQGPLQVPPEGREWVQQGL